MSLDLKSTNPKDAIGIKKVPLSLVPGPALVHQAMAHKNGALKYGKYNWRDEGVSVQVYIDACLRHIHSWYDGEESAHDSGVHHLAHAIACLNIILDSQAVGNLVDDRPKPAPTRDLLDTNREQEPAPSITDCCNAVCEECYPIIKEAEGGVPGPGDMGE